MLRTSHVAVRHQSAGIQVWREKAGVSHIFEIDRPLLLKIALGMGTVRLIMAIRPTLSIWLLESGPHWARTLFVLIVQLCLATHGTGIGVTLSTVVSLASEECNEELKSEVEVCAASHKCGRLRFASPHYVRTSQRRPHPTVTVFHAPPLAPSLRPTHLLGAGIALRC